MQSVYKDRLTYLKNYPYYVLPSILGETHVEEKDRILLHIGEPKTQQPECVRSLIDEYAALWSRYPPVNGTVDLRNSIASWLNKRYDMKHVSLEGVKNILCLTGSKEGIVQAVITAKLTKETTLKSHQKPAIILPSPAYHVYFGAAIAQDLDIITVRVVDQDSFVADIKAITSDDWERCVAMILCSPNNPTGMVLDKSILHFCLEQAQAYDLKIISDECYSEIYADIPPCGVLEMVGKNARILENIIVLNSLSKRSGVPGIRSGFIATGEKTAEILSLVRGYVGTQLPGPNDKVAQFLWQDEEHVQKVRQFYNEALQSFACVFQDIDSFKPSQASFFNWFDCKVDAEKFARRLWKDYGVSVLPGNLMTNYFDDVGKKNNHTYLRLAAIYKPKIIEKAARAMKEIFMEHQ